MLNIKMYSCIYLGLKIIQIKILWNVVDDFGALTTWRHMKTSSLKCKDQTFFGFVYASILINFKLKYGCKVGILIIFVYCYK